MSRTVYQQSGDKWKDHIYPKSELEKTRSNTLNMTILKEDNQTEKPDGGSRWSSQYRKSPKRKIIENPRSVPSRDTAGKVTTRSELRSSMSKDNQKIGKETGVTEKLMKPDYCEPSEK